MPASYPASTKTFTPKKPGVFVPMEGKRFGRWVVMGIGTKQLNDGSYFWLSRCDCGIEREVLGRSLRSGVSTSCGCLNNELAGLLRRLPYGEATKKKAYRRYVYNAKTRGLEFLLSFDEFYRLSQQPCYYCGELNTNVELSEFENGDFLYNGIDRVNNSGGYVIDNCVSCCIKCNVIKKGISTEMARKIINFIDKKGIK